MSSIAPLSMSVSWQRSLLITEVKASYGTIGRPVEKRCSSCTRRASKSERRRTWWSSAAWSTVNIAACWLDVIPYTVDERSNTSQDYGQPEDEQNTNDSTLPVFATLGLQWNGLSWTCNGVTEYHSARSQAIGPC